MSDESKWHGHGIFDQDCLKCQNKELQQEVERLRDGVAAIYGDAEVPDGLPVYEVVKMSPSALITHCKALLEKQ